MNGTELQGRALKINEAKPKTDRPGGGGGGRGFGVVAEAVALAAVVVAADARAVEVAKVAVVAVDAMTIRATLASPENRAGSLFRTAAEKRRRRKQDTRNRRQQLANYENDPGELPCHEADQHSTSARKNKPASRKQREKVERRTQRGQEKPEGSEVAVDEMEELRRHAEEQAALFHVGFDEQN